MKCLRRLGPFGQEKQLKKALEAEKARRQPPESTQILSKPYNIRENRGNPLILLEFPKLTLHRKLAQAQAAEVKQLEARSRPSRTP